MPKRIQRKRTKGWRMPENTVSVCRPGKWGNPFKAGQIGIPDNAAAAEAYRLHFEEIGAPLLEGCDLAELRGKDLACFCPLDQPCHADVLLRMANQQSN